MVEGDREKRDCAFGPSKVCDARRETLRQASINRSEVVGSAIVNRVLRATWRRLGRLGFDVHAVTGLRTAAAKWRVRRRQAADRNSENLQRIEQREFGLPLGLHRLGLDKRASASARRPA